MYHPHMSLFELVASRRAHLSKKLRVQERGDSIFAFCTPQQTFSRRNPSCSFWQQLASLSHKYYKNRCGVSVSFSHFSHCCTSATQLPCQGITIPKMSSRFASFILSKRLYRRAKLQPAAQPQSWKWYAPEHDNSPPMYRNRRRFTDRITTNALVTKKAGKRGHTSDAQTNSRTICSSAHH